jgi:hypothetical protein
MLFEVYEKENSQTKITIAKERTTVKILPSDMYMKDRIVNFAKKVEEIIRSDFDFTRRGRINFDKNGKMYVCMCLNSINKNSKIIIE